MSSEFFSADFSTQIAPDFEYDTDRLTGGKHNQEDLRDFLKGRYTGLYSQPKPFLSRLKDFFNKPKPVPKALAASPLFMSLYKRYLRQTVPHPSLCN
jgi:hypothetical protein